jgi:hypothetical protein
MKYYTESRKCNEMKDAIWTAHNLHRNCLLKHMIEEKIKGSIEVMGREEEDMSSYWMTSRKREDTGI